MAHTFVAYIDESGDEGLTKEFRTPGKQGGQSNWLVLSACMFRQSRDREATAWRDEIISRMPRKKTKILHFADLNPAQKTVTCECLCNKPLRMTSVLSNKQTIPKGTYSTKNQLYFYLARYLIERVSWFCRARRPEAPEGDGTVKLTFSRCGGMNYTDFQEYLTWLKVSQETEIHWPVIDIAAVEAHDHSQLAPLQVADALTSAFAAGLEPDYSGNCKPEYAEILKPIVYCRNGNYFSYGTKLVPSWQEMTLSADQMRFINLFR
jgi:hypothetical protein